MNWYMIKTKDTYVSKFFIFLIFARSGPEWGYDWWTHINMDVTLPFWVRSRRRNVKNRIATMGGPYLVVEVRGILLPWIILRRERHHDHIWISNFLWRQFHGVGLFPYRAYGRGIPIYGDATTPRFLGCLKCPSIYYSQNLNIWFFPARTR